MDILILKQNHKLVREMKEGEFIKVIKSIEQIEKLVDDLYKIGVDVNNSPIFEYEVISDTLWKYAYGQEGTDWIYWWLYERDRNKPTESQCYDENGPLSINTISELYNFIESNYNRK